MNKDNISRAFADKILGVRNYKSQKKEFFVDDFLDEKLLDDFLDEVYLEESDITPAGKSFLKNYFGFENLAINLLKRNKFFLSIDTSSNTAIKEISFWLKNLEPMKIVRFIEESKGTIDENTSLIEELLPPKEFDL